MLLHINQFVSICFAVFSSEAWTPWLYKATIRLVAPKQSRICPSTAYCLWMGTTILYTAKAFRIVRSGTLRKHYYRVTKTRTFSTSMVDCKKLYQHAVPQDNITWPIPEKPVELALLAWRNLSMDLALKAHSAAASNRVTEALAHAEYVSRSWQRLTLRPRIRTRSCALSWILE